MQLWFAHGTEISLREQLVTQVVLGILCGDLAAGQRLPSTRELARRFRLHPNTVSAGYRQLKRDGWVEFRHGSGVYVHESRPGVAPDSKLALDQMIGQLFRSARHKGVSLSDLRSRLRRWLDLQPPDHFLLIESDKELSRIAALELRQVVEFPVESCGLEELGNSEKLDGAIAVAFPTGADRVRRALPSGTELLALRFQSVPASLAEWLPAPSDALVGIASRWPQFLKMARTMLLAAGFHPHTLIFRDARKAHWQRGLRQAAAVVCDSATAAELPKALRILPFRLLADASLEELRRYRDFITRPSILPYDTSKSVTSRRPARNALRILETRIAGGNPNVTSFCSCNKHSADRALNRPCSRRLHSFEAAR